MFRLNVPVNLEELKSHVFSPIPEELYGDWEKKVVYLLP